MAFTALMFVVLIIGYVLMFWLVGFTEKIIAPPESVPSDGGGTVLTSDTNKTR